MGVEWGDKHGGRERGEPGRGELISSDSSDSIPRGTGDTVTPRHDHDSSAHLLPDRAVALHLPLVAPPLGGRCLVAQGLREHVGEVGLVAAAAAAAARAVPRRHVRCRRVVAGWWWVLRLLKLSQGSLPICGGGVGVGWGRWGPKRMLAVKAWMAQGGDRSTLE